MEQEGERIKMQEAYRLVLQHYFVADDGDRLRIDEPIVTEQIFDRENGCTPVVINRLFDEMKHFTLMEMSKNGIASYRK